MKLKILFIALLIVAYYSGKSQSVNQTDETVKLEPVFDLQIGMVGAWAAYEHPIAPKMTMRYDLGISSDMWMRGARGIEFSMYTQISAETRFYHHQISSLSNDKNTSGNSGNFLALKLLIAPSSMIFNTPNNVPMSTYPRSYASIMPRYGIRRMITEHFHYELAFGLGYGYILNDPLIYNSRHFLDYNVHIRIGYTF